MTSLYASDVLKIFRFFEPSRQKLWEIVRMYNPIDFARLLYLLENIAKTDKRPAITLEDDALIAICSYPCHDDDKTCNYMDFRLKVAENPDLLVERVTTKFDYYYAPICQPEDDHRIYHSFDISIEQLMENIRSTTNHLDNTIKTMNCDVRITEHCLTAEIFQKIIYHNLGTRQYSRFLTNIQHLLYNEHLQTNRNDINTTSSVLNKSIVSKYFHFYRMMHFLNLTIDSRQFRNLILPKAKRIYTTERLQMCDYIAQPLYQGFHCIVYATPTETKFYNRYGELLPNLGYNLRIETNCTFEAIILPVDRENVVRSWRYWTNRNSYVIYCTDIFRYENQILDHMTFEERLPLMEQIKGTQIRHIPAKLYNDWTRIEKRASNTLDMFEPIVGIVFKLRSAKLNAQHLEYRFSVNICYDLLDDRIVRMDSLKNQNINRSAVAMSLEMSAFRTVCLVYGHDTESLYMCEYDRQRHQFVHCAILKRIPDELTDLNYRTTSLFVLHAKIKPQGLLYLRVYYDRNYSIIGYEQKITNCQFDVPYCNELFMNLRHHHITS